MTRKSLTSGMDPEPADPTLDQLDTTRPPQQDPPGPQLVTVYLVNGTRTSAGPGPGPKQLPAPEANALVRAKLAVAGTEPPRGYEDGGQPEGTTPAVAEFREGSHAVTPRAGLR